MAGMPRAAFGTDASLAAAGDDRYLLHAGTGPKIWRHGVGSACRYDYEGHSAGFYLWVSGRARRRHLTSVGNEGKAWTSVPGRPVPYRRRTLRGR